MQDWQSVRVIAHRCGGLLAPENSLAGLVEARRVGVSAVEFDAMLSADGVPVLIHDETLERTTLAQGRVDALPAEALLQISCARWWEDRFPDERIPSLAQAIERCGQLELLANVEIKPSVGQEQATGQRVADVLESSGVEPGGVLLSSFSELALAQATQKLPDWPAALLFEQVPADWSARLHAVGATDLHCNALQADWRWLADALAAGVRVRCYTVNERSAGEALFAQGVTALFTDDIGRLPAVWEVLRVQKTA